MHPDTADRVVSDKRKESVDRDELEGHLEYEYWLSWISQRKEGRSRASLSRISKDFIKVAVMNETHPGNGKPITKNDGEYAIKAIEKVFKDSKHKTNAIHVIRSCMEFDPE